MSAEKENKTTRHWGTIFLGVVVAIIFLTIIFSFQLKTTECAVVSTLGRLSRVEEAGWHWRWPYPIQSIHKFDNRVRCFEGIYGKLEETLTRNGQNIILGTYVNYRISDPEEFYKKMLTVANAESQLSDWMRSANKMVAGQYDFEQFVNTDPKLIKLGEMEKKIKAILQKTSAPCGMEIMSVGINYTNIPESNSKEVFARMISERETISKGYRSQGKKEAQDIRTEADKKRMDIIADARAQATRIRAEGDAEAAKFYAKFQENPDLAVFLRKLDSLKRVIGGRTTLILDTDSAPFDLLKMGSEKLDTPKK
jgi:membrane protease subunit HflC